MNACGGRVWAEISLDRLKNNYEIVRKSTGAARVMAAIKADAYGHGAIEVARILESEGIYMFGVAGVEEGIELRDSGIKTKILVLSPILYSQIDTVLDYDIIPTISELGFFDALDRILKERAQPGLVHVEVDTGMTRTGFPIDEAERALAVINASPRIKIDGIFSHFPLADADGAFTQKQIDRFNDLVSTMKPHGIEVGSVHIANSSGIFRWPKSHYDLVRPGIALYGLRSSPNITYAGDFKPVMKLKSRVVNLRVVEAGTPVSYGHTYRTKRQSKIATVSVGYGDGYPRLLSNKGEVLIRANRAPIVGTVCMDLIMVDVTDLPAVEVGDIVTLFGEDGNEEITVEECAAKAETIVYEITSGIGPRVARVFKINDDIVKIRTLLGRWGNGGC
ncbi:MAG: alanine racemase [candidate division WOR-3 bacterium]|nr:MAG: alanine racemase [candidate division WOR-3 bacterium]